LTVRIQSQAVLTQNEDAEAQLVHSRNNYNCPPGWILWISTWSGTCIYIKTRVTFTRPGPQLWLANEVSLFCQFL